MLLTGHTTFNRHLTAMKTCADLLCSVCIENEETSFHFLDKCRATMLLRYSLFGAHLLQPEDLYHVGPATLSVLQFVTTSKGTLHELNKMATLSQHDLPLLISDFL